jgi:hypothetical protein
MLKSFLTFMFLPLALSVVFAPSAEAKLFSNKKNDVATIKISGTTNQIEHTSKKIFIEEGFILLNTWGGKITFMRPGHSLKETYPEVFAAGNIPLERLTIEVDKVKYRQYQLNCLYHVTEGRDGKTLNIDAKTVKSRAKEHKALLKIIKKKVKLQN